GAAEATRPEGAVPAVGTVYSAWRLPTPSGPRTQPRASAGVSTSSAPGVLAPAATGDEVDVAPMITGDPQVDAAGATTPDVTSPTSASAGADASTSSIGSDVSAATDPCAIAPTGAAAGLDTASSASASGSCATAAEPSGMAD